MFRLDGQNQNKDENFLQLCYFFVCFPLVLVPETFPDITGHGATVEPTLRAVSYALETLLFGLGGGALPLVTFHDLNTF